MSSGGSVRHNGGQFDERRTWWGNLREGIVALCGGGAEHAHTPGQPSRRMFPLDARSCAGNGLFLQLGSESAREAGAGRAADYHAPIRR